MSPSNDFIKLTLEFGTLSKYTQNETYINLALTSAEHIANLVSFASVFYMFLY
jgi:hypothetical protein